MISDERLVLTSGEVVFEPGQLSVSCSLLGLITIAGVRTQRVEVVLIDHGEHAFFLGGCLGKRLHQVLRDARGTRI